MTHRIFARALERLEHQLLGEVVHVLERGEEQGVLGLEVEGHDPGGEAGLLGHPRHRGAGEPVLGDRDDGCFDELTPPLILPGTLPVGNFNGMCVRAHGALLSSIAQDSLCYGILASLYKNIIFICTYISGGATQILSPFLT